MKVAYVCSFIAVAAFGCGDDKKGTPDAKLVDARSTDGGTDAAPDAPAGTTVLRSTLSGFQEVPPVFAAARGAAVVGIDDAATMIDVELSYTGLTGITAAHIHVGKPGTNGPVIFTLASAEFTSPLAVTLTAADFTAAGGVTTFAEAVQAMLDGNTYINVHTGDNPGGALRGHVGKATINAIASGAQENPPVTTTASGTATLTLDEEQDTIQLSFDSAMVTDATAAHIHVGEVGQNGPVIFDLGTFADPLVVTLEEAELTPQAGAGIATMRDAVDAILSGRAYINVHTTANPGGELRAQLGAVTLRSSLTPGQETMAVTSNAKGRSFVTISADQTTITTSTTYQGIMQANLTAAHIHAGGLGVAGPPIFTLSDANAASPINKVLGMADFTAGGGLATFADAVNALLVGSTYVNIHTTANANGEIRGQIGRVRMTSSMNGTNERPTPVVTLATATAAVTITGSQREVHVAGTYNMLENITAAHIHVGTAAVAGPVIFPLAAATFASPFTFVVGSGDLTTQTGVMNMADAIGKMLDGDTYINIHTTLNANGEVRGQIEAP